MVGSDANVSGGQGWNVSLSADGNIAAVSALNNENNKMSFWIYKRSNGVWSTIDAKNFNATSSSSTSLDISQDGKTVIIGREADNNAMGAAWVLVQQPTASIKDISINEDAGTAQLQVCLSEPTNQPVTVQYAPSHGSAKADSDYVAVSGTLTIPAGQTCATIPVTMIDDTITEAAEDAVFRIFNATNATIGDAYGAINIKANDRKQPIVTAGSPFSREGDIYVTVPICIAEFDIPATVSFRTSPITAESGKDYIDTSGTVTFTPGGPRCAFITIRVLNDTLYNEPTEQFDVIISNPVNTQIIDSTGTVTIFNNNRPRVDIKLTDVTVNENAGTATVFVNVSQAYPAAISGAYRLVPITATGGEDFVPAFRVDFVIPERQTSFPLTIPIIDDNLTESTENFNVELIFFTHENADISYNDPYGAVNILDNDGKGPQPGITITKTKLVKEGINSSVDLDVCLTNPHSETITVEYVTNDGSATAGTDYAYMQSFVRIYPGATCTTISIPVKDDQVLEGNETFTVRLINPANGTIVTTDAIATITIEDNNSVVCPAGAICIKNTCPSTTVNLNTAYSIPNLPAGTVISWHTGTPATDANRLTPAQAQAVSVSGSYYASIYSSVTGCYTPTLQVVVNIVNCNTTPAFTQATTGIQKPAASENTILPATVIAPNPFNNSFNVAIHSGKSTKAVVTLIDIYGRQMQTQKTMLNVGKNNIAVNPGTKIPPGNYFLKIKTGEQVDVHKLVKQ